MSETIFGSPRESSRPVTWVSLMRTIRAPFGVLTLAGLALVVPPQTADMLAALDDSRASISPTIRFHLALALLALSAWYWSRALLAARFDAPDNEAARRQLPDVAPLTYELVPRLMFAEAVLIGIGMIVRSSAWSNLAYLAVWALLLGFAVWFRDTLVRRLFTCFGIEYAGEEEPGPGMRNTDDLCLWMRQLPARFRLLIRRAPWPNWISFVFIMASLAVFVWGTLDAFLPWSRLVDHYPGLPALAAWLFPGPAVALFGLAMIIAPLALVTFLLDGLNISITVLGITLLRRPPVVTVLVGWTLLAPTLFSLHTVRIVAQADATLQPTDRRDLSDLFTAWVDACAPKGGAVRPIIVAVSGGASRAAIWGERVLSEVEKNTGPDWPRIFAVSSVSGGSVGVAAYMAILAAMDDDKRCGDDAARRKQMDLLANHQLSEDALGPLLAGALLVDIPRALFTPIPQVVRLITNGEPRGGDRAEALERAFEALWHRLPTEPPPRLVEFSDPYLSLFYRKTQGAGGNYAVSIKPGMPLWIANGTDMASGGRLDTVPFDPTGHNRPLLAVADTLAALGADVRVSTAINNTARFPYLEPAGELLTYVPPETAPAPLNQRRQPDGTAREIIDGGYFDNEGIQTALELAAWLSREGPALAHGRAVEPIIVEATADGDVLPAETVVRCEPRADDPTEISDTRRPLQLLAPLLGLYNVRGGHAAVALRQAREAYCADDTPPVYQCDTPTGLPVRCVTPDAKRQRFFHFYLPGDGATPVPLNWILSDTMARYIWEGAMQAGGNPREATILREALTRK